METIFHTHRSTKDDAMQLLTSLFSTEERYKINNGSKRMVVRNGSEGVAKPDTWIQQGFPTDKPNWDYNTEEGRIQLDRYRTAITQGLKREAHKPVDMSKPALVIQNKNESPSEFYEAQQSLETL